MAKSEEINEEFGNFCINVTEEILSKCVSLCAEHHLSAEDLVYGWVAYSSEKDRPPLCNALLEKMVRTKLNDKSRAKADVFEGRSIKIYTKDTIDQITEDDANLVGSSPISGQSSKRHATPTQATPKRGSGVPSRSTLFSPTSYSPTVTATSERYQGRTGQGDIVSRCGGEVADWSGGTFCVDSVRQLTGPDSPYRYMLERLADRTDVLNAHILTLGERLKERCDLGHYAQPHAVAQEPVCVVGRIACDGQGRLNSKSILLEGGKGTYGEGQHVELDVSQVQDVGLFTGQVVAVRGVNPTGKKFVAFDIYAAAPPPLAPTPDLPHEVTLLVACGPFTTAADVQYSPLRDLLTRVSQLKPQLLLLIGPFVDAKIIENELAETYQQLWERLLQLIRAAVEGSGTRVLLVPSTADLHSEPVLPTPPFAAAGGPFSMLSNPCCVDVGGLVVGVTSCDVLMHLSQQDVKLPGPAPSDRLARLAGYLIDQQCFYPLYPPDDSVGVDFQQWRAHCQLAQLPHVLVTPSDFNGFVKEVSGCLVVNPSRLARGQVGGTFARIRIPTARDGKWSGKFAGQVLKI